MLEKLREIAPKSEIIKDCNMSKYTSFKAGGNAQCLAIPANIDELKKILIALRKQNESYMIFGNGSNIIVKDGGFKGTMVKIGDNLGEIELLENNILKVGAGALLSTVSKFAMKNSLTGIEFASGIPGSMGGAVFMNAGAYGGEIKDILKEVRLVSIDGAEDVWVDASELGLAYRYSMLQDIKAAVVEVKLQLQVGNIEEIQKQMTTLMEKRNSKQPVNYPSAGSFFKRPKGYYVGQIIEEIGLKGLTVGGAQVSQLHGGFFINIGNATSTDIVQLMHLVQASILKEYGVKLEPEVRLIGED